MKLNCYNTKILAVIILWLLFGATHHVLAQSPGGVTTNLDRWYKADVGVTLTGGAVSDWANQSGAAATVTQGTANQRPAYNTTANLLNFNPVLSFDGGNDRLANATGGIAFGTGAYTVYYVASNTTPSASTWALGTGASAALNGFNSGSAGTATTVQSGGTTFASQTNVWAAGVANLVRTGFNGGTAQPYYLSVNSATEATSGNVSPNIANTNFCIGARPDGTANFWGGLIAEVIVYTGKHGAADAQKVETYLAIKYGITKAADYANTAGTVIWTSGGGYDNNIAGIGRDDDAALNQKQSQSLNSGIQPIIGNTNIAATNADNTNNFGANLSHLVWGSNTGSTTFNTQFVHGNISTRMGRIWKVQVTGTIDSVKIALRVSDVTSGLDNPTLIVSDNSTFDGTDTRLAMAVDTINGVDYYTAKVVLTDGQFFTFGGLVATPGSVSTDLQRWFRADAGVTTVSSAVSDWKDQSALVSVSQATSGNRPAYSTSSNLLNFNPALSFDGTNDRLSNTTGGVAFGTGAHTFYYVASNTTPAASNWVFGMGASAALNGFNSGSAATATTLQSGGTTFASQTSVWTAGIPTLVRTGFNGGTTQPYYQANRGGTAVASANVSPNISSTNFSIGARPDGTANFWAGNIAELIVYSGKQTTTDTNKIESYLSIKYGISKTGSYVNSSGSTIWTSGGGYDNNVAGIGRDDMGGDTNAGLNQKQSRSQNAGNQVILNLNNIAASNAANTGSFTTDMQYLTWGDNNSSGTTAFSSGLFTTRLSRVWRAQNTNTLNQDVKVLIPTVLLGVSQVPALLYSTSSTFASGNQLYNADSTVTVNSVSYYSFTLPATQVNQSTFFFTLAYYTTAPGGVTTNLQLWLKADAGYQYNYGWSICYVVGRSEWRRKKRRKCKSCEFRIGHKHKSDKF